MDLFCRCGEGRAGGPLTDAPSTTLITTGAPGRLTPGRLLASSSSVGSDFPSFNSQGVVYGTCFFEAILIVVCEDVLGRMTQILP